MEMNRLVEKIHSDTKSLENRIHDTCLQYFQHSLNLVTIVNYCMRGDYANIRHSFESLLNHGEKFKNFCELFSQFRKFTKMQIIDQDTCETCEIILDYKERGHLYFVDDKQLFKFQYENMSRIRRHNLLKFTLSYVSSVNEDFKSFSENVKDLYEKSQTNESDFFQHEERLRELEEKYKNFRVRIFKNTLNIYENIIHEEKNKFDKKYCETDLNREIYGIVPVVFEKFNT